MGAWALTIDITIGAQCTPMPRRASNNFENLSVHNSAHSGRLCFHSGRYNGRSVSAYWLHHMLQVASKITKYSNYLVHRDRKKPIENKRPLSVHCSARCYKHKRPLWMLQWTLMISYIGSIRGLGKAMKTQASTVASTMDAYVFTMDAAMDAQWTLIFYTICFSLLQEY